MLVQNFHLVELQIPILVVALSQMQFIFGHLGVVLGQLLVHPGGVEEVLAHVVAVGQERHGAAAGAELQLIVEVGNGLDRCRCTSLYLPSLINV